MVKVAITWFLLASFLLICVLTKPALAQDDNEDPGTTTKPSFWKLLFSPGLLTAWSIDEANKLTTLLIVSPTKETFTITLKVTALMWDLFVTKPIAYTEKGLKIIGNGTDEALKILVDASIAAAKLGIKYSIEPLVITAKITNDILKYLPGYPWGYPWHLPFLRAIDESPFTPQLTTSDT